MTTTTQSINAQRAYRSNGSSLQEYSTGEINASRVGTQGQSAWALQFLLPDGFASSTINDATLKLTLFGDDSAGLSQMIVSSPTGTPTLAETSIYLSALRANSKTVNSSASATSAFGAADYEVPVAAAYNVQVDLTALLTAMQSAGDLANGRVILIGRLNQETANYGWESDEYGILGEGIGDTDPAVLDLDYTPLSASPTVVLSGQSLEIHGAS